MDDDFLIISAIIVTLVFIFVLPIVAIVRTLGIGKLERRLAGVEAALRRALGELEEIKSRPAAGLPVSPPAPAPKPEAPARPTEIPSGPATPADAALPPTVAPPASAPPPFAAPAPVFARQATAPQPDQRGLEQIIGQRWIGWIAVGLILFAAAFFLKYAFENQWIGPAGRVAIGVAAGMGFVWMGWQRFQAGWKYFSQILTGGGVTLLYLSIYGAFGFYELIDRTTAFGFLVFVVIVAHWLAVLYDARAMAIMAQIGGFLVPLLLSSGSDRYVILFAYIAILNLGVVLVSFMKNWHWVGAVSFSLTYLLFLAWYSDNYGIEKRPAALAFLLAVFALYLLADLAPRIRGRASSAEQWIRLTANPFLFFAFFYDMLESDYKAWMGASALVMATLYAAVAKAAMGEGASDRKTLLVSVGVALVFVTLAIPIQLESNWIAIGWAVLAAALAWISGEMDAPALRVASGIVFVLAAIRHFGFDTYRVLGGSFTPVVNKYYLSGLAIVICLFGAAWFFRGVSSSLSMTVAMIAIGMFWLDMSIENYKYYDSKVFDLPQDRDYSMVQQIRWTAHMVASVLWSILAAVLTTVGFRLDRSALRWAGLILFGVTVLKVVFVDMSQLEQIYRIIAFFVVGILLLGVAWGYQRAMRREVSP